MIPTGLPTIQLILQTVISYLPEIPIDDHKPHKHTQWRQICTSVTGSILTMGAPERSVFKTSLEVGYS
jgi:hypothetical protein